MRKQIELFFIALMFYTQIPSPIKINHTDEKLNKATRYFPLVGWIVGVISFVCYYLSSIMFPNEIAVLISLVAGIFTTGAFHEDGFADFFDGFGGGWTKTKILDIMKDSRVGTYGMVSSILLYALKFYCILYISEILKDGSPLWLLLFFILYHSLARWTAIQLCFVLDYAREDELSKAKPIAKKQTSTEIVWVYFYGLLPLIGFSFILPWSFLILLPLALLLLYFRRYLMKWLGGYTGDCLGAVEQIAELVIMLTLLVVWKFM